MAISRGVFWVGKGQRGAHRGGFLFVPCFVLPWFPQGFGLEVRGGDALPCVTAQLCLWPGLSVAPWTVCTFPGGVSFSDTCKVFFICVKIKYGFEAGQWSLLPQTEGFLLLLESRRFESKSWSDKVFFSCTLFLFLVRSLCCHSLLQGWHRAELSHFGSAEPE